LIEWHPIPHQQGSNTRISDWPGSVRSYFARPRPNWRRIIRGKENPARALLKLKGGVSGTLFDELQLRFRGV
jgi:hypothetical protein